MGWQFEGKCAVTGERVEEALPRMGDFVELISPSLGRYRITGSAAEKFDELTPEQRMSAFNRAKESAEPGMMPQITTHHL